MQIWRQEGRRVGYCHSCSILSSTSVSPLCLPSFPPVSLHKLTSIMAWILQWSLLRPKWDCVGKQTMNLKYSDAAKKSQPAMNSWRSNALKETSDLLLPALAVSYTTRVKNAQVFSRDSGCISTVINLFLAVFSNEEAKFAHTKAQAQEKQQKNRIGWVRGGCKYIFQQNWWIISSWFLLTALRHHNHVSSISLRISACKHQQNNLTR